MRNPICEKECCLGDESLQGKPAVGEGMEVRENITAACFLIRDTAVSCDRFAEALGHARECDRAFSA